MYRALCFIWQIMMEQLVTDAFEAMLQILRADESLAPHWEAGRRHQRRAAAKGEGEAPCCWP